MLDIKSESVPVEKGEVQMIDTDPEEVEAKREVQLLSINLGEEPLIEIGTDIALTLKIETEEVEVKKIQETKVNGAEVEKGLQIEGAEVTTVLTEILTA